MSTREWETDRDLSGDLARELIELRFPGIEIGELEYLGSGWEFDAYRTADDYVFRFPRRKQYEDVLDREGRVHELVIGKLPEGVAIPVVELKAEPALGFPYRFVGHRYIPGIAGEELEESLRSVLATELGRALGAIHSIPVEDALAIGVRKRMAEEKDDRKFFEHIVEVSSQIRGHSVKVDEALKRIRQVSFPFTGLEAPRRFIHADLQAEHVLADPLTGRLNGILDWTDVQLGDAAYDFASLVVWGGWDFFTSVVEAYPLSVDGDLTRRVHFIARWLSVMALVLSYERGIKFERALWRVERAHARAVSS